MGGVKCPVCSAVTTAPGIKDGEMIRCANCKAKFTVTKMRRSGSLCQELGLHNSEVTDSQLLEEFVARLDDDNLLFLVRIVTGELVDRYRKKEGIKENFLQEG